MTSLSITSGFDSGNIIVTSIEGDTATLEIRKDAQSDFYQWFHFRLAGAKGRPVTLKITNCGGSAYPGGWANYQARYSVDRDDWRCADTLYADGVLTITHTPEADAQGLYRFARGQFFYAQARAAAATMHAPFNWTLATAPGIAHFNNGMAPFAVRQFFP